MLNNYEIFETILRSVIAMLILGIVIKFLGRKQLSHLTLYDYVVSITIGSIAADAIISVDKPFINGVAAIISFGGIAFFLSCLALKSSAIYNFFNGGPLILIENGTFNMENLKKSKITIFDLLEQSRLNGYYDIKKIDYAVLETTGQISFLTKENNQSYCYSVIVDNEIQIEELKNSGKSKKWLISELKKRDKTLKDNLALVTVDDKNHLKIYENQDMK